MQWIGQRTAQLQVSTARFTFQSNERGGRVRYKSLRFLTLMLAALGLTAAAAHVLELPQKMQYEPETYALVNATLYRWYALVGGPAVLLSIVFAFVLAYLVRREPATFELTLLGASCLLLAFILWLVIVAPVNAEVHVALQSFPESVPALWMRWRDRWEYGHAAAFVFQLGGLGALVLSILQEPSELAAHRLHRS